MSKNQYNIVLLPGDGIGPEIMNSSKPIFDIISTLFGHKITTKEYLIGGIAIDAVGNPLPDETLKACLDSDSALLVAVGGDKWDSLPTEQRPEKGLLRIRKGMNLYANLRRIQLFEELKHAAYISPKAMTDNLDLLIVRELTGDAYFGLPRGREIRNNERVAFNTMIYSESEIRRITKLAMELAMKRNKKVCSVDKANVLEVSVLWREVAIEVSKKYPEIELSHMYVDNASMQLIRNPKDFDVMVTSNIFGDILSDEASMIAGSIGMLPSASLGDKGPGLYEPIHGSAPQLTGLDKANPLGTILSIAMLYKYSLGIEEAGNAIENAVKAVLRDGFRTADIMEPDKKLVGCNKMGVLVSEYLKKI